MISLHAQRLCSFGLYAVGSGKAFVAGTQCRGQVQGIQRAQRERFQLLDEVAGLGEIPILYRNKGEITAADVFLESVQRFGFVLLG